MEWFRSSRFWFLVGIVFLIAAVKVALVFVPNIAPIGAMALFAGAYFSNRVAAFLVPLVALFLGDAFQELFIPGYGFHSVMPFTYGAFAIIVLIGFLLRDQVTPLRVGAAGLSGSIVFFLVSNFGVWATGGYPLNLGGLMLCYEMAIPFLHLTVLGDLFFVAVLFGGFALAQKRVPALAAPVR